MISGDGLFIGKADKEPYGHVDYADEGHQKDGKKRYPIDTEEHIRAAWNYIHQARNAAKYTPEQAARIKAKIAAAWKRKIDSAGPPSAKSLQLSEFIGTKLFMLKVKSLFND